jgi:hypothetical protein
MMKTITTICLQIMFMLILGNTALAQAISKTESSTPLKESVMKTYLIEREIPGAGKLTPEQLKAISQKSCGVLKEMGSSIQWVQSYVTGDKIYCIYKATDEKLVREHALKGGFPANNIVEITTGISPATAQ